VSVAHDPNPVARVLDALSARGCNPRQAGPEQWSARCPVTDSHKHGDKNPSLSVGESPDGAALVYCHAGCTLPQISTALELAQRDLFPSRPPKVANIASWGREKARYDYHDAHGERLFQVRKYVDSDGSKTFRQFRQTLAGGWVAGLGETPRVLYQLPQVLAAVRDGRPVILCEGEKDAETASWLWPDAATTCNPGGAGKWTDEWTETLRGAHVIQIGDNDRPGVAHVALVRSRLAEAVASYVALMPPEGHKDLTEAWGAGKGVDDLRPFVVGDEPDEVDAEPDHEADITMPGGMALRSIGESPPARWGNDDAVLWASGESLLIVGRTGVGKTTLTIGVLSGLCGITTTMLGVPVRPARRVLYLAMDRPRQILRAMARRFTTDAELDILDTRLVIRKGPLPTGLDKAPDQLLLLAQRHDCDVVIVDSLKDAAVKLVDDEVGGQVNRAIQLCNAVDIDVVMLHHQRKGDATQRKDADTEPSVEDVFGSSWITAGAGSVVILSGQPGSELVKLWHVKQPAEPVGPWMLEHDHQRGRTEVVAQFDLLGWLRRQGPKGATAAEAAKAEHQRELSSTSKEAARAKRKLNGLVAKGLAETSETAVKAGVPQRWTPVDNDVVKPRQTLDGGLTPPISADLDASGSDLDGRDKTAGQGFDKSLTPLDGAPLARPLTDGGGYTYPPVKGQVASGGTDTPARPSFLDDF
jgi:replicative DNA helicase